MFNIFPQGGPTDEGESKVERENGGSGENGGSHTTRQVRQHQVTSTCSMYGGYCIVRTLVARYSTIFIKCTFAS